MVSRVSLLAMLTFTFINLVGLALMVPNVTLSAYLVDCFRKRSASVTGKNRQKKKKRKTITFRVCGLTFAE